MLRFEQMENGLYLLTYEQCGVTLKRVFAEPSEKVNIADLKPVEKPDFEIVIND